jgi:hypothetical protein
MDQMKTESNEFKKLVQIASHPKKSKSLFLDFVRNDTEFE